MEDGDPSDLFRQNLKAAGLAGLPLAEAMGLQDDPAALPVGKRVYDRTLGEELQATIAKLVDDYGQRFPLRLGLPKEEARRRCKFKGGANEWNALVQALAEPGTWVVAGDRIAATPEGPPLPAGMAEAVAQVAAELAALGLDWPGADTFAENSPAFKAVQGRAGFGEFKAIEVMRHLADHGLAVAVNNEYFVHVEAMAKLVAALRAHFAAEGELAFAGFRELSGLTRKLGIPMLEYLDENGLTVRDGDIRRAGPALATPDTEAREARSTAMSSDSNTAGRPVCAPRRPTRQITVGTVTIGGDAPVRVQCMTTTKTGDFEATHQQIKELATAGAELVRVTVNDDDAVRALPALVNFSNVPLVADIHYDHKMALAALEAGIAKLRINPGNIGSRDHVREVAAAAKDKGVPIRIGVNRGSLHRRYEELAKTDPAGALVQSGLDEIEVLAAVGFHDVAVSLKSSQPLGSGRGLPPLRRSQRRAPAPGRDRGRHPAGGHQPLGGGHVGAAVRGHRRHGAHQPGRRPGARGHAPPSTCCRPWVCARASPGWWPAPPAAGSRWTWWPWPAGSRNWPRICRRTG